MLLAALTISSTIWHKHHNVLKFEKIVTFEEYIVVVVERIYPGFGNAREK